MRIVGSAEIDVRGESCRLRVLQGDLALHAKSVDTVVLSYGGSLTGAFARQGLKIRPIERALANRRLEHKRFRSWLVDPIRSDLSCAIVAFEAVFYDRVSDAFRHLFESLMHFSVAEEWGVEGTARTVAMPVLLTGLGGFRVEEVAPTLIAGMLHWLALGLPFRRVDLVVHAPEEARRVAAILSDEIVRYRENRTILRPATRHDVFISYSHRDAAEAEFVSSTLRKSRPDLRIFHDERSLDVGAMWQHRLYVALDASRRVLGLLSPHYVQSRMCLEEYNIAVLRERQDRDTVLFPVLIEECSLYRYMQMRKYVDCRSRDREKLAAACGRLVEELDSRPPDR